MKNGENGSGERSYLHRTPMSICGQVSPKIVIVTWLLAPCVMPPLTCLKGKLVWLGKARGHRHTRRGRSAEDADAEYRDSAQSQERDHSAQISPPFPPKKKNQNQIYNDKKQTKKTQNQTLQSNTAVSNFQNKASQHNPSQSALGAVNPLARY